jgi:hypothetical protein
MQGRDPPAQKASKKANPAGTKIYGVKSPQAFAKRQAEWKEKREEEKAEKQAEQTATQKLIDSTYKKIALTQQKGRTFLPKKIQDRQELFEEIKAERKGYFNVVTAADVGVYIDQRNDQINLYTVLKRNENPASISLYNNQTRETYTILPNGIGLKADNSPLADPLVANLIALPRNMYHLVTSFGSVQPPLATQYIPNLPETPMAQQVGVTTNTGAPIFGWNLRNGPNGDYAIRSDNEYVTYIRHLKYTTGFSNDGIEATTSLVGLPHLPAGVAKTPGYETLRKVLFHCANTPALHHVWFRYKTYSFIRNVIDFLHDYVHEGVKLLEALLALRRSIAGFVEALYGTWLPQIRTAITAGGKVNQTTCKLLSKNLVTEFKRWIKSVPELTPWLSWLVIEKEDALVTTANKSNPANIGAMLLQAYNNGCRGLYIESLATSATRLFSQLPDRVGGGGGPAMNYFDVLSGYWDAGSGISYIEAARAKPGLASVTYARSPAGVAGTTQLSRSVNAGGANAPAAVIGNSAVGGFGLFPVEINEAGNGSLTVHISGGPSLQIIGRKRLSVNGLLNSVGLPGVRGSGEAGDPIVFTTVPAGLDLRTAHTTIKLAALCLKQWTDTIQTDDIVNSEAHILAAYSDYDAEEYCAMIGGTSIMQRGRDFFYYCYDMTKRQVSAAEMERKRKTMVWALSHAGEIGVYVECWHRNVIASLNFIVQDTEDPAVFFAAVAMLNRLYENMALIRSTIDSHIRTKNPDNTTDVSLFPSTGEELLSILTNNLSVISIFDETYSNLQRAFASISGIRGARLDPVTFQSQYANIQQQIINALPLVDERYYSEITALFFAYGFLLPFDEIAYQTEAAARSGMDGKQRTIDNVIVSLQSTMAKSDASTGANLQRIIERLNELRGPDLATIPFNTIVGGLRVFVPSFAEVRGCDPGEAGPIRGAFPSPPAGGGGRRKTRRCRHQRRRTRNH